MYHLFHSRLIILAEIDSARLTFAELVRAGSIEESAPRAHNSSVTSPLSVVAGDGEIAVFTTEMQPVSDVSDAHSEQSGTSINTHAESAVINSFRAVGSWGLIGDRAIVRPNFASRLGRRGDGGEPLRVRRRTVPPARQA